MGDERDTSQRPAHAGLAVSGAGDSGITDYPDGISAIDTHHLRPRLDASHLIVQQGRAAFVDTGTALSVPRLLAALEAKGIGRDAVDWVFLTHIHLDHAGGAGVLLRHLPNARVVVHPRGVRHLADPTRLIQATKDVYGEDFFSRVYGEIAPIETDRLVATEEGLRLDFRGRPMQFLHTPGHAIHHYVMHDLEARVVFTGDTFGLSYREFDVDGRPFILPTTSPSHFDEIEARRSYDRIVACGAEAAYLTHYSRVTGLAELASRLHGSLDAYVDIAERHREGADRARRMQEDMYRWLSARLDAHGYRGADATRHAWLDLDIDLNVQGLMHWIDHRS
jgi:glyoxylase-like metal-dependent hydrolase (beta-lactamase superfamily II)